MRFFRNDDHFAEIAELDESLAGKVYDLTTFYRGQHSDTAAYPVTTAMMLELAGQDLTNYFPVPLVIACPGLVADQSLVLQKNFTPIADYAVHYSGTAQVYGSAALSDVNWYPNKFLPFLTDFYKGAFVYTTGDVAAQGNDGSKFVISRIDL